MIVSRPQDDSSRVVPERFGVRIVAQETWPDIGAELSANYGGNASLAQIYRVSDSVLMGETDITGLSAGDVFTVTDVDLQPSVEYNFVVYDNGNEFTSGELDSPSFPYTSADGNLEITDGAFQKDATSARANNLLRVGNVGFE